MIGPGVGETVLAVIPARGGSKGIPRKNIRLLAGKPLIAWTIEAARACPEVDRLILSSDDPEIMATAIVLGCEVPFVRPAELATDTVSAAAVALHALAAIGEDYSWVILLQPTSPLRQAGDIRECLRICMEENAPACVTMALVTKNPHWFYSLDGEGRVRPWLGEDQSHRQRQELPPLYYPNGAVYVARSDWLRRTGRFLTPETRALIMPPERSMDIDMATDWHLAEFFLKEMSHGNHPLSSGL